MARNKGTFPFSANLEVKMAEPLDPRQVVSTLAELTDPNTYPKDGETSYLYNGLLVSVVETGEVYMLKDAARFTALSSWQKQGGDGNTGNLATKDELNAVDAKIGVIDTDLTKVLEG